MLVPTLSGSRSTAPATAQRVAASSGAHVNNTAPALTRLARPLVGTASGGRVGTGPREAATFSGGAGTSGAAAGAGKAGRGLGTGRALKGREPSEKPVKVEGVTVDVTVGTERKGDGHGEVTAPVVRRTRISTSTPALTQSVTTTVPAPKTRTKTSLTSTTTTTKFPPPSPRKRSSITFTSPIPITPDPVAPALKTPRHRLTLTSTSSLKAPTSLKPPQTSPIKPTARPVVPIAPAKRAVPSIPSPTKLRPPAKTTPSIPAPSNLRPPSLLSNPDEEIISAEERRESWETLPPSSRPSLSTPLLPLSNPLLRKRGIPRPSTTLEEILKATRKGIEGEWICEEAEGFVVSLRRESGGDEWEDGEEEDRDIETEKNGHMAEREQERRGEEREKEREERDKEREEWGRQQREAEDEMRRARVELDRERQALMLDIEAREVRLALKSRRHDQDVLDSLSADTRSALLLSLYQWKGIVEAIEDEREVVRGQRDAMRLLSETIGFSPLSSLAV